VIAERYVQAALFIAAVIHLLPVVGITGTDALQRLYGVDVDDPALLLLLRHRALLFALVAMPLLIAIAQPGWRVPALVGALLSIGGFLLLTLLDPPATPSLVRVARIDWGVLGLLVPALVLSVRQQLVAPG